MERFTRQEMERFEKFCTPSGKCKVWMGYLDKDGYGSFFFRRFNRRAHRVAYYMHVGDVPKGMVVDHACGVRNCVQPSHLRLLTPKENSLDSRSPAAINARKTHCSMGHPFDKVYGGQRCCSVCNTAKKLRLLKKWKAEDKVMC